MLEWMGLNFYYYDGLQPKIRAGIINEHECKYLADIRELDRAASSRHSGVTIFLATQQNTTARNLNFPRI